MIWRCLYLLGSDWISTMVSFLLMSEVSKVDPMTLRQFKTSILSVKTP